MNCSHIWDREFMDSVSTKSFVNVKLKNHHKNILFEREKCLLPETQPLVEKKLLVREMQADLVKQRLHLEALRRKYNEDQDAIYRLMNSRVNTVERATFCRKCPVANCKGFLTTRWKCELCKNNICKECNEIREEEDHVCKPENVETTKLLNKDTKPCPSCGTMIFKISGCSQMWCTSCHVAFDWNTLRIEKGVIHNPHFFEFQRTHVQTRNNGDIPCGGRPNMYELRDLRLQMTDLRYFLNCLRMVIHIENITLRYDYRVDDEVDNSDLRVHYMMNQMSENDFKKNIYARDKKHKKNTEFIQLFRMAINTTDDILRQLVLEPSKCGELKDILEQLRLYINNASCKIGKRYGNAYQVINDEWRELIRDK